MGFLRQRPGTPPQTDHTEQTTSIDSVRLAAVGELSRRRFGRQVLVGLPLLGAALAAAGTETAEAASADSSWKMGGNDNVNTDGTNFIGSKNNASLMFKT